MTERKKTTTFGLGSEKVARLLKIGAEVKQSNAESNEGDLKAELLRDRLAETLSLYDAKAAGVSKEQNQISNTIARLAGKPIGELLLDPAADLAMIRQIKDHGRRLSESAKSEAEHRVANTVYYAAIASALIHCSAKITMFSYSDLRTSLSRLATEGWIADPILKLFEEAAEVCRDRAG